MRILVAVFLFGYALALPRVSLAQQNLDTTLANGNMGIGTTTPVNALDVSGGVAIGTGYAGIKTAPTGGLIVQGNVGIGTASPSYPLQILSSGTDAVVKITTPSGSGYGAIYYAQAGSLSSQYYRGLSGQIQGSSTNHFFVGQYADPEDTLNLYTGGSGSTTRRMTITTTGVAIGTGYAGTYSPPQDGLIVSGNVGIGTNAPQATLDVKGYARLTLQSSAPATCSATNQGAIALNHLGQICVCNGTAWNFDSSGSSCSW